MLEITTATESNTLLQVYYFNTWTETKEQIEKIKKMNLYNIEINLYKKDPEIYDNYILIDNFYKIEKKKQFFNNYNTGNKKTAFNIFLVLGSIVLFPIMIIFNMIKKI